LVDTKQQRSYPICLEQVVRSESEKAATQVQHKRKTDTSKRKPGRPKDSRNTHKTEGVLTDELKRIQGMVKQLLALAGGWLPLRYLVLDGYFGNNKALQMVRQCGLSLISRLRADSALYFPYDSGYSARKTHHHPGRGGSPVSASTYRTA
jgi:putative transposase